jgi:hypothetical protein
MNIFLPYEDDIVKSVQSLDDVRLQKQAVEVYQLLTLAIKEQQEGHEVKAGHYHHPVYLFYKDNIPFLAYYGYICCCEYLHRFYKRHTLLEYFQDRCSELLDINCYVNSVEGIFVPPKFTPYYMEGSKGQPNYIRTTDNVSALFQQKLINKWNNDKAKGRTPKWTNRQVPEFYKKEMGNE